MSKFASLSCPHCPGAVLDATVRAGIEVDVCPTCRGVWLDRGELDRLLGHITSADSTAESSVAVPGGFAPQPSPFGPGGDGLADDGFDDRDSHKQANRDDDHDDDDDDYDDHDDDDDDDRRDRDRRKGSDDKRSKDSKDAKRDKDRKDGKDRKDAKRSKKRKKKRSITYLIGEAFEEVFDL